MRLARTFRSPRESKDSASTLSGRSLSVVVAMAMAGVLVGIVAAPSAAVAAATPTLGIHDGSINVCDHRELRTGLPAKKGAAGGSQRSQPDYAGVRTAMDSPYWAALNVRTIRFSPPWDVADPSLVHSGHSSAEAKARGALRVEQACLSFWLHIAAVHNITPQIAFKPDYNYLNVAGQRGLKSGAKIMVPDILTYTKAIQAFTAKYSTCSTTATCNLAQPPPGIAGYFAGYSPHVYVPMARVTIISPWGEPDDTTQLQNQTRAGFARLRQLFYLSTNPKKLFGDDPVLAAKMWVAVNGACSGACTVIAGDFGPYTQFDGGRSPYLTTYAKNLNGLRPAVWGEHPYSTIGAAEHSYEHGQAPPDPVHTVVGRFADALRHVGYGSHTQIWLNEISANDPGGVNGQAVQAKAGNYLLTELIQAGGRTIPREGLEPVVTAIYYLDYTFNSRAALVYGAQEPPRFGGKPRMIYCVFVQRAGNPNSGCKPALQQRGARPQPPRARRPRPHRRPPAARRTPPGTHRPGTHRPAPHRPAAHRPAAHRPAPHPTPPGARRPVRHRPAPGAHRPATHPAPPSAHRPPPGAHHPTARPAPPSTHHPAMHRPPPARRGK